MEEKKKRKWRKGEQRVGTEEMCEPSKHYFIHKGCRYVSGGHYENTYECIHCGYKTST
jgi:hypothetical protein